MRTTRINQLKQMSETSTFQCIMCEDDSLPDDTYYYCSKCEQAWCWRCYEYFEFHHCMDMDDYISDSDGENQDNEIEVDDTHDD